jgi:hypothetical protein
MNCGMSQHGRPHIARVSATFCAWLAAAAALSTGCGSSASDAPGAGGSNGDAGDAGNVVAGGAGVGGIAGQAGSNSTAGGSSAAGSAGASDIANAAACQERAAASCPVTERCYPIGFSLVYRGADDCKQVVTQRCLLELAAPQTSLSASNLSPCVQATTAQTCDEYWRQTPAACAPPGGLALGAGCEFNSQCASTFCSIGGGPWCGVCAARGALGESCDPSHFSCQTGLKCARTCPGCSSQTEWQCVKPVALSGPCQQSYECEGQLVCKGGLCAAADGAGATCNPSLDNCDESKGLQCAMQASGAMFMCVATTFVGTGGACNYNTGVLCSGGGFCAGPDGTSGICKAPAESGQPCDASKQFCALPAQCLNGTCTPPPAAASCH